MAGKSNVEIVGETYVVHVAVADLVSIILGQFSIEAPDDTKIEICIEDIDNS